MSGGSPWERAASSGCHSGLGQAIATRAADVPALPDNGSPIASANSVQPSGGKRASLLVEELEQPLGRTAYDRPIPAHENGTLQQDRPGHDGVENVRI